MAKQTKESGTNASAMKGKGGPSMPDKRAKRKLESDGTGTKGKDTTTPKHKRLKKDGVAKNPEEKVKKESKFVGEDLWSKSKKKRMRMKRTMELKHASNTAFVGNKKKKQKNMKRNQHSADASPTENKEGIIPFQDSEIINGVKSSSLQEAFKARLTGSRFRILNEDLYTTPSATAYQRFRDNPELFEQYHEGFRHQVEVWPVNPVNVIVDDLKKIAMAKEGQEPLVVADFGCGDAELAKQLLKFQYKESCPFKVHSFDLVSASDLVTACDMAHVPLPRSSVDVGVFCLSLMGTNLSDFIREAHRVLKDTGRIKIAEVRSRFESNGKSEKDEFQTFIDVLDQLGFECVKTVKTNEMFVLLELKKNGKKPRKKLLYTAKPCIYKRR